MATIVTRVTGVTAKGSPLTSAELDQNFINLNDGKLETTWTGSTNLVTLGAVVTGTWNATTIATTKGGTGLTSFVSGGAVYATSTSALTTGTLPVSAGGTGTTTSTGSGAVVLSSSPTLITPTLGVASATSLTTSGDITVGGNLIVNGTTTTINSTTISVDDKNLELGSVATPTNATADGGGITLKGATDKTFNWVNTTGAWTSSEHIDLASGKNIYLRGSTSGTVVLAVPAAAGTTTITFPATTGTVITTGDTGTVTSTMIADGTIVNADINASAAIAISKLAASTISGISLGNNLNALTLNVAGTGLSGSTTYNGSSAATFTVTSNATSINSSSTIVARDGSGNFVANTITASLSGNASTATKLLTARNINGVSFDGSADITVGIAASDDTTTNASYYPSLSVASSGFQTSLKVSSTKLYFNPSTGTLNSTTFNSLSDINQKTNIVKIENATGTLSQIDSFEFDWIDTGKHSAGVIAQHLEKILPFLVDTNENGVKSVNYGGLIAYLIQSNKELASRLEKIENNMIN